jgi:hypothetical protein
MVSSSSRRNAGNESRQANEGGTDTPDKPRQSKSELPAPAGLADNLPQAQTLYVVATEVK